MRYYMTGAAICRVPRCDNLVYKIPGPGAGKSVCYKHWLKVCSGRVSKGNMGRDIHRMFLKGYCEHCGVTAKEQWDRYFKHYYPDADRQERVRLVSTLFHVDHVNGRSCIDYNDPNNLQTLCIPCHRVKTIVSEDYLGKYHQGESA